MLKNSSEIALSESCEDKEIFAHYTSSKVIENLPDSDFNLLGPVQLLNDYRIAPKCGELFSGGIGSFISGRDIAFTSLGEKRYRPHDKMIENYSFMEQSFQYIFFSSSEEIKKEFDLDRFSNQTSLQLALQAQAGKLPDDLDSNLESIRESLDRSIGRLETDITVFYVMRKFVVFPWDIACYCNNKYVGKDIVKHMISKIRKSHAIIELVSMAIDTEDSNEIDNKILEKLTTLFKNDSIVNNVKTDYSTIKISNKPASRPFEEVNSNYEKGNEDEFRNEFSYYLSKLHSVEDVVMNAVRPEYFIDNDQAILKENLKEAIGRISYAKENIKVITDILNDSNYLKVSNNPTRFHKKFPVAFIVKGKDKSLKNFGNEFRADKLNIGNDVKIIAVPKEHIEDVQKFLSDHHRQQEVSVCNIDLLKQNLNSSNVDEVLLAIPGDTIQCSNLSAMMIASVNDA